MLPSIKSEKAFALVKSITNKAISGVRPLISAEELAHEYLNDSNYSSNKARMEALIKWETSKNGVTGFISGLGGLITLPVSVPAALGSSWIIQARLAATIAIIYGHNINEDRVRTMIILCLIGNSAKEVLKEAGIKIASRLTTSILERIPGRLLIEINKKVGFRLLTKAGEKGVINIIRQGVPLIGGLVSGTIDVIACRKVGLYAQNVFKTQRRRKKLAA